MKVVIAMASSSGQLSGVQRHAMNLARCLLMRIEITEVHLIAAPWQMDFVRDTAPKADPRLHLHAASIGNSAVSRNLWFLLELPRLAKELGADVVHLAYPVPVARGMFPCPLVATLHDLYPQDMPENFGFPKVYFNRAVLWQCLHAVDAIACVSECTLSRLEALQPRLAPDKATVICNSVEAQSPISAPSELPRWDGAPFLLCVAQHRKNKNIPFAIRIYARLLRAERIPPRTRLVIVGIDGPETKAIEELILDLGLPHQVVLWNGISEVRLQWCYRNCRVLLAPSAMEGFGLPVAEALLAGCRVVCSDIPAFREVGGRHCRYVALDERAEEAFAEAILDLFHAESRLPIALPQLAPAVIGEKYLRMYQCLLESKMASFPITKVASAVAEERQIPL